MKTRTPWLLCAALVIVSAAAPALGQESERGEPSEGRRTGERERERERERDRDRDSSRDEPRSSKDSKDSRDSRGSGRAERDGTRVAARDQAEREEPARDGAGRGQSPEDDGVKDAPRDAERDDATLAGDGRDDKPKSDGAGTRSWLAKSSTEPAIAPSGAESGSSVGLTLGAVVLVLGLAAAAIAMRFKKRDALPLAPSEARLTVLSSSRVGPKAFAVTAHVNGRPLLLGVTDHTVTLLGWLDAREPNVAEVANEATAEHEPEDELPEDYPGSALRVAKVPTFASSSRLERFQEVLRGAEEARADLPMRPSYAPSPLDAATLLASQTSDVVTSSQSTALAMTPQPATVSLRRKRRSRESLPPREARSTLVSRTPKGVDPSMEGQVAGLRALRNGG